MISSHRLNQYVNAEPFRPFRLGLASGQTFEIRHPEMIAVSRTYALIYTYPSDDAQESAQREHEVSLLLMESVEPLDMATTPEGGK